jgi:hypothetical protein
MKFTDEQLKRIGEGVVEEILPILEDLDKDADNIDHYSGGDYFDFILELVNDIRKEEKNG